MSFLKKITFPIKFAWDAIKELATNKRPPEFEENKQIEQEAQPIVGQNEYRQEAKMKLNRTRAKKKTKQKQFNR